MDIGSDTSRLRAVAPTPTFDLVVRDGERGVDLRELHKELDSSKDFTTWARFRLSDFVEGLDFEEVSLRAVENLEGDYPQTGENLGGRPSKDWSVSIDCAKHIAMMERTERGQRPSCPGVQDISCTNLLLALAPNDSRDGLNQQIGAEAPDRLHEISQRSASKSAMISDKETSSAVVMAWQNISVGRRSPLSTMVIPVRLTPAFPASFS